MPSLLIYRAHCHGQRTFTLRIVRRSRSTDTRHSAHSDRERNNLTPASATSLVVLSYRRFQPYNTGIETESIDAVAQERKSPESNDCRTTCWWCRIEVEG